MRSAVIILVFQKTHDTENQGMYLEKLRSQLLPVFLGKLCNTLEENGSGWLIGSQYTWADLFCAAAVEFIGNLIGREELLKELISYPILLKHFHHVFALPQIKKWVTTRPEPNNEVEHVLQFLM